MKIHGTTACYPGKSFEEATARLAHSHEFYGSISTEHVQLCPQTTSEVSVAEIDRLRERFPNTQFRLHANVRRKNKVELFDCSVNVNNWLDYIADLKAVNDHLGRPDWSIHAGRAHVSLDKMYETLARVQDMVGSRVAIEGLYPSVKTPWNLSTYEQYADLMNRDCFFALDLSHVNIMRHQDTAGHNWVELIESLMTHKNCIEIHLSDNDGREDVHMRLDKPTWWWASLCEAKLPEGCVVFTEGSQTRKR